VIRDLKAKGLLWNQTANLKGEPSVERALMVYGSDRNSRRCNCLTPLKSDPAGSSFSLINHKKLKRLDYLWYN